MKESILYHSLSLRLSVMYFPGRAVSSLGYVSGYFLLFASLKTGGAVE